MIVGNYFPKECMKLRYLEISHECYKESKKLQLIQKMKHWCHHKNLKSHYRFFFSVNGEGFGLKNILLQGLMVLLFIVCFWVFIDNVFVACNVNDIKWHPICGWGFRIRKEKEYKIKWSYMTGWSN